MERTLRVLNNLEHSGILGRFAIGGAVGAMFYMEPVATFDLDVFVTLPESPSGLVTLTPLYEALKQRGYVEESEFVDIEGLPVQFLPAHNPLILEAVAEAANVLYDGVPTHVMTAEHLAEIMVQTGRDKERERLLTFMRQAPIRSERFQAILARHGLLEKWNQWKT